MDAKELPARPNLERYKKLAKDFVKAFRSAEPAAIERVLRHYSARRPLSWEEVRASAQRHLPRLSDLSRLRLSDGQFLIARSYAFESWPKFAKHIFAVSRASSPVSKFESAVDAIITGDIATLKRLLRQNPKLIRERSTRMHRATLLHYVSANGVEDFRQKTPKNAVEIAELLLQAGAEVDAVANAYGKDTTLGLVATSIHPKVAGVQMALLETLLAAGADVNGTPGGWNPLISALHNGRGDAAEFLAKRGARLDLEGAAGAGWLDVVKSFFSADGSLKMGATKKQMELGFLWACEYGRNSVVDFLLEKGVDLHAQENTGLTGLHWAVVGGQVDTIKLLLKHGARLEVLNVYGGTVLSQTIWCGYNGDPEIDYVPILKMLIAAGANVDAYPKMRNHLKDLFGRTAGVKMER